MEWGGEGEGNLHLFYVYLELQLFLDMFLADQWVEQCTTKTASARNPSLGNLSVILYYIVLFQFLLYFARKFFIIFFFAGLDDNKCQIPLYGGSYFFSKIKDCFCLVDGMLSFHRELNITEGTA